MILRALLLITMFSFCVRGFSGGSFVLKRNLRLLSSASAETGSGVTEPNCLVSGLVPILKPTNWTSRDVVSYVRKTLEIDCKNRHQVKKRPKIKVGHGGTLDPLATGVLVLGIGKGTKVMGEYLKGGKKYEAEFEVGYETDTLDLEGKIIKTCERGLTLDPKIVDTFKGEIMQQPPMFSALHIDGRRLYELAREGLDYSDVDVPKRPVVVKTLEIRELEGMEKKFEMECEVGGGTYIRSLIRDLAYGHGTLGTMTKLERTEAGGFTLEDCISLRSSADEIYEKAMKVNELRDIEF